MKQYNLVVGGQNVDKEIFLSSLKAEKKSLEKRINDTTIKLETLHSLIIMLEDNIKEYVPCGGGGGVSEPNDIRITENKSLTNRPVRELKRN